MNVLIDTSVWSLAFRRARGSSRADAQIVAELTELIQEGRVLLMGPIRQELLSGARGGVFHHLSPRGSPGITL